jgi:hypothetical protein
LSLANDLAGLQLCIGVPELCQVVDDVGHATFLTKSWSPA